MELAVYINKDLAKARLTRTKLLSQRNIILKQLEMLEKEMSNMEEKQKRIQDELSNCNLRADAVNKIIKEKRIRIASLSKEIINV